MNVLSYFSNHSSSFKLGLLLIGTVLPATIALGQESNLDTIYANEAMQVALFFPAPIAQAITGNPRMSFTYNKEQPQRLGLLKATPGKPSNLLVIDQQQRVYAFVLTYQKELPNLHYSFSEQAAILNLKDEENTRMNVEKTVKKLDSLSYAQAFANYLLKRNLPVLKKKREQKIKLTLFEVQFYKEQAYLIMELSNYSKVSFIPGNLHASLQTKKQGKRHSMQRQNLSLVRQMNIPVILRPGETKRFMLMLSKFTIPEKWVLNVSVQEQNGRRHLGVLSSRLH